MSLLTKAGLHYERPNETQKKIRVNIIYQRYLILFEVHTSTISIDISEKVETTLLGTEVKVDLFWIELLRVADFFFLESPCYSNHIVAASS